MPIWAWIIIAVLVIVVIAAIAWGAAQRRRRQGLQEQFGPEYDRAVQERSNRREAESDLEERRRRREALDIRPLSPAARARYSDEWRAVAIKSMTGATGRQRVQEGCFNEVWLPQPPFTLLKRFSESTRPMFRLVQALHNNIGNLRLTRDLLLPQLLSGKVQQTL